MERLIRTMLIQEDADELWLTRATPRYWLANGEKIQVENAATLFGDVSFTIVSSAGEGKIEATVNTRFHHAPSGFNLRFRHPEAKSIRSVEINGKSWDQVEGDVIKLDTAEKELRIVATYAG